MSHTSAATKHRAANRRSLPRPAAFWLVALATAAPTFGLGVGAIVTGLLVQYAPHPTRLIYAVLMGLFVLLLLATIVLPETNPPAPGAVTALRPEIAVPARARRAFAGANDGVYLGRTNTPKERDPCP